MEWQGLADFEFIPTRRQTEESNIYRFMQKHGLSSLDDLRARAIRDPGWFWSSVERDLGIVWSAPYDRTLDSSDGIEWTRWFVGGKTNIYSSSVEKFAKRHPSRVAYRFVSEDGGRSQVTYSELDCKASKLANALRSLGVKKGDVVAIYLPMIQEAILAMLAAAKIGAVHTVIFSGYGPESLRVRLQDCKARILFVSDGFYRRGKAVSHRPAADSALQDTDIDKIIVVPYGGVDAYERSGPVVFYDELVACQDARCGTEAMDSEDPLFVLYTSGTTGLPKGVVHVHGGFSVFAGHQSAYLVDTTEDDVLFWPADIGWITGLVWNVYGLLLAGSSAVIYDGALDYPDTDAVWRILSEYGITIFGISPTAVRMFRKNNDSNNAAPAESFSLEKIKNIPTTGEPLDEDSWRWLFEKVGSGRVPIMNLSGGTEIGGAMLSVLPGMKLKPSTVGMPVPGMHLDVLDDCGNPVRGKDGYLVVRSPWPAMTRGLLNDDGRFLETYWSRFENVWFHGDYVCVDDDNLWYMRGRTDDVINVAGHRMSTAEIEHAVMSHGKVSDAASVAIPDEMTGEAIVVFFVAAGPGTGLESEVSDHVSARIGKVARPKLLFRVSDLPKTRTGKIMRRLLKSKLLGEDLGDLSPLENPGVLDEIPELGR